MWQYFRSVYFQYGRTGEGKEKNSNAVAILGKQYPGQIDEITHKM